MLLWGNTLVVNRFRLIFSFNYYTTGDLSKGDFFNNNSLFCNGIKLKLYQTLKYGHM